MTHVTLTCSHVTLASSHATVARNDKALIPISAPGGLPSDDDCLLVLTLCFWSPPPTQSHQNPRGEVRGALFLMALSRSSGSGAGAAAAVISDASFVTGPPFANPASSVTTRMTGALFDTFHLRRAALGSEDESWREVVRCGYRKNNPQDIIGYSGCIPTGNPAKITPIVRICVRYSQS